MSALEEQLHNAAQSPAVSVSTPATSEERRELSDWQAQLIAMTVTIGSIALFMLLFSLLTGSL